MGVSSHILSNTYFIIPYVCLFHLVHFFFVPFRFSDMLVGAPYHRHEKFGDEGRVYVYMNNQKVQIA